MRPKDYYESLLADMPNGAERAVLRVLSYHIGLAEAIQKPDLIEACAQLEIVFKDERQVRLTIVKLRDSGIPLCSSSGDSGYFLAATLDEYREFRGREYVKKIKTMTDTVKAMDAKAKAMFPVEYQQYLEQKAERAGQPALL